jgi:hypothetical protein
VEQWRTADSRVLPRVTGLQRSAGDQQGHIGLALATSAAADAQRSADPDALAWYGMLNLRSAVAASLDGAPSTHLTETWEVAERRPQDLWLTEFTPANTSTRESAVARGTRDHPGIRGLYARTTPGRSAPG